MMKPKVIDGRPYVELCSYGEIHPPGPSALVARGHFGDKPITILEIGVLRGHNAEAMNKLLKPELMVLVDPWGFCGETHDSNWADTWFRIQDDENIVVLKAKSELASKLLTCNFDFIYIDGDHIGGELSPTTEEEGIRKDIKLWLPRVNEGGIIAGHDYNYDNIGLEVNTVFGDKVNHSPYVQNGTQEWWVYV